MAPSNHITEPQPIIAILPLMRIMGGSWILIGLCALGFAAAGTITFEGGIVILLASLAVGAAYLALAWRLPREEMWAVALSLALAVLNLLFAGGWALAMFTLSIIGPDDLHMSLVALTLVITAGMGMLLFTLVARLYGIYQRTRFVNPYPNFAIPLAQTVHPQSLESLSEWRKIRDAIRSLRALGGWLVILGCFPFIVVMSIRKGWPAYMLAGSTTIVLIAPGVWYLMCASLLRKRQWHVCRTTLWVGLGQTIFLALLLLLGLNLRGSHGSMVFALPAALMVFFLPAMAALMWLVWRAGRVGPRINPTQRAFETLPASQSLPVHAASEQVTQTAPTDR